MRDSDEMVAILEQRGADLEHVRVMMLLHRELTFSEFYTLTVQDLVRCYPGAVDPEAVARVAMSWSLALGDLQGKDPADFFLDNPVRTRPFIRIDEETFACPNIVLLHSYALELVEAVIASHPRLDARYDRRRGRFLEESAESLLRRYFPSGAVHAGSKWTAPDGKIWENDVLVVLDRYALVVEAKAANVSDSALRGAPERLEKTIDTLVVAPTRQGRRFVDKLTSGGGRFRFSTKRGITNDVDLTSVRHHLVVNVTLELFSVLGIRWAVFREAGMVPDDLEPAVTLSLVDLEVVLDALDTEAQRLHYLARRTELEARKHFAGDEFDLLAHYLRTGFNLGDLEFADGVLLDLNLQSKRVDRLIGDIPWERPPDWEGLPLSPLWRRLLADLQQHQPPGWTEAALDLLCVPHDEQRPFGRLLDEAVSKARRAPGPSFVRVVRRSVGPAQRRLELVGVATKGLEPRQATEVARREYATGGSTGGSDVRRTVVLCARLEDRPKATVVLRS